MCQFTFFRRRSLGFPLFIGFLFFLQPTKALLAQSPCDCTFEITGSGPHLLSDLIEEEVLPGLGFGGGGGLPQN